MCIIGKIIRSDSELKLRSLDTSEHLKNISNNSNLLFRSIQPIIVPDYNKHEVEDSENNYHKTLFEEIPDPYPHSTNFQVLLILVL